MKDIKLEADFDYEKLIDITEGYSGILVIKLYLILTFAGSDLKEICRTAAMNPVREKLKELHVQGHIGIEDTAVCSVTDFRR